MRGIHTERDCRGLINDYQFCLPQDVGVLRSYILDGLSMVPVDIHPYDRLIEVRICGLKDGIIGVVLVVESVKRFEDKFEQGL